MDIAAVRDIDVAEYFCYFSIRRIIRKFREANGISHFLVIHINHSRIIFKNAMVFLI
jgi:hypothetical protein